MSKQVDQKVVEMQFDNKNFEKNVSKTMSTLDKLKQALSFKGAESGLTAMEQKANSLRFNGLANTVDNLAEKFSGLQMVGTMAMIKIAQSAADAGIRMAKSLSIDQIASGWNKLQQYSNSVSTLISQGYQTDVVEKEMEKLNWFSDETSYNFTDMIDNISKFTATGQELGPSVTAMEGIALWAATAGQNAQKASGAMYQLSQALSAGYMRKEDWKSIQNYNMDTREFRQRTLDAAVALKTLKKNSDGTYQSLVKGANNDKFTIDQFVENLTEGQWFTKDVMMNVYEGYSKGAEQVNALIKKMEENDISLVAGDIISAYDAAKEGKLDDFMKKNDITGEAAKTFRTMIGELDEFGMKALKAGQEYRTFNDVIDATSDAVSTKWMNIFKTIIGNVDQQKALWSTIGEKFYDWFAGPLDNLQEKLDIWVEKGGRENLFSGLGNIASAIGAITAPIKEAFRDIFPSVTGERLAEITEKFKEFTSKLIIGEKTAEKIKNTFSGLFAIVKTGIHIVTEVVKVVAKALSLLAPLGKGIVTVTSALGKWIDKSTEVVRRSHIISDTLSKVVDVIKNVTNGIGKFLKETLKFDNILKFFKGMFTVISQLAVGIGKAFATIIRNGDMKNVMDIFNTGLLGVMIKKISDFFGSFKKAVGSLEGFGKNIKGMLEDVRGILQSYQKSIDAKTLMTLAKAIALLAASLFVLASIDSGKLGKSLAAMAGAMTELLAMFKIFTKMSSGIQKGIRSSVGIVSLSLSLLIMASALKKLSSLSWDQVARGLTAMGGALLELMLAMKFMPKSTSVIGVYKQKSQSLIGTAISMVILASALKKLGNMSWNAIAKSLVAMGGALLELTIALKFLSKVKNVKISDLLGMTISMVILGTALNKLGAMSWSAIAKALTAMGGALLELTLALNLMPKSTSVIGVAKQKTTGLLGVSISMVVLATALKKLASLSWSDIGRSLTAMGGALAILTGVMAITSKAKLSSKGLLSAAASLIVLGIGLRTLAKISWGGLIKSLVAMSSAFLVLGVAVRLLKPVAGTLLVVSGAIALFGVGMAAIGAGLILISAGIAALGTSLAAGTTAIVAGLSAILLGILGLIPEIIEIAGQIIIGLCNVLIESAPLIGKAIMVLIYDTLKSLADYAPMIIDTLFDFLIGVIRALIDRAPEFIEEFVNLLGAIFGALAKALKEIDPKALGAVIVSVGILAAAMYAMAGLTSIAGPAALGLLAFGGLVVELGAILAAIGLLNKIPGLKDFINGGGELLLAIGTAIGKFVGGIIGGVGAGISASMPEIATNLSTFMENLKPFIEGANSINPGILINIGALSGAIIALSAANLLAGITNLIPFGPSLPQLGSDLSEFMKNAQGFIDGAMVITPNLAKCVSAMANAIVSITGANVLNGISSFFTFGKSSLKDFGNQISELGTGMKKFVTNLGDFSDTQVKTVDCACNALVKLSDASKKIPNSGGVAGFFAGENDIDVWGNKLPKLAEGLTKFMSNLGEFNDNQVKTAECAANVVAVMAKSANEIPNTGGLVSWFSGDNDISQFAGKLPTVGTNLASFITNLGEFGENSINTANCAANVIATMAQAANEIPNTGGLVSWFTGDNDISQFSGKLPQVGTDLASFMTNLGSFDTNAVNTANCAGNVIATMAKAANKVPNTGGIVGWFKGEKDISQFTGKLPGVATDLGSFITNVGSVDTNAVNTANCAANVIAVMAQAANNVPNTGSLVGWFTGEQDITTFAGKLPSIAGYLSEFILGIGSFSPETVTVAQAAANVIATMAEAANKVPNTGGIVGWFTGDQDISTFADKLPNVGTKLGEFITNLQSNNVTSDSVGIVKAAGEAIGALANAAAKIPNTGGLKALFTGDNDISAFAGKFGTVGQGLHDYMSKIGNFGDEQVKSVKASTDALTAIAGISKLDTKNLETNFGKLGGIADAMNTFINKLKSASEDDVNKAKTNAVALQELVTEFNKLNANNVEAIGNGLKTIGENGFNKFLDNFGSDDAKNKIVQAIHDLIDKLVTGAEQKRSAMEDKFLSLGETALGKLTTKTFIAKVEEAGKMFTQGFADGINYNTEVASDAGRNLGNAAYNAAKRAIDAHSPSKKGYKLGGFFGQGFLNGIHSYMTDVYNESYSMADQAKNGLTSAIQTVNNILDGEMDSQPTIRPVLDLTNVESGASRINGLLSNANIRTSLSSISSTMKTKSQNGANSDVVSAIDKLGNNLGRTGDTYNINGINYSDDTAIGEALKVIIRAATVERRT